MKFVLATANPGKVKEMQELLSNLGVDVVTRDDMEIDIDVEEIGTTFLENATLKATAIMEASGQPAIADDSGLVVDALAGDPGLYSSSYGGELLTSTERCEYLLKNMKNMEQRQAKFVCNIVCAFPNGDILSATGECYGTITTELKGTSGFGYDPVFLPNGYDKTMAELTIEEKNKISHRGKALISFTKILKAYLTSQKENRKMRIGIFGGAFNPPHIGHVNAAKIAIKEQKLDLLIVIPTGTPPHKDLPTETPPPYIRFTMTENAFSDVKKAIVSDIEIYNSESSNYTIDTIHKINKDYPNSELFLLVGNDMYDSLDTWKDSKELKKLVTPVLLPREKVKISSTEIRDLLPKRKGNEYISKDNYALIIKHRYYKAKPNFKWLREEAHSMLDTKRIPHVDATEEVAVRLASFWNVNKDDAGEAAILHDITKRLDFEQNMCIITSYGLISSDYSRTEEKIIHAITGAIIAKTKFGVSDDVANAIRRHTTGCRGMTTLDKIIYIADYIEATREMPQIEDLRKLAFENLNKAVVMGLEMSVNDLLSRDIIPNAATYDALDNLRRDIHETVRRQE